MRITIVKCKCDICREVIEKANDMNTVKLNAAEYDLCQPCYEEFCEMVNMVLGSKKRFRITEFFDGIREQGKHKEG
jgi:hypothetical protein